MTTRRAARTSIWPSAGQLGRAGRRVAHEDVRLPIAVPGHEVRRQGRERDETAVLADRWPAARTVGFLSVSALSDADGRLGERVPEIDALRAAPQTLHRGS